MSRSISIEELNKRIDKAIEEYEAELNKSDLFVFVVPKPIRKVYELKAMVEALQDLKIDLNDPESVEDITENVQQTLNVVETKKIIDDEL